MRRLAIAMLFGLTSCVTGNLFDTGAPGDTYHPGDDASPGGDSPSGDSPGGDSPSGDSASGGDPADGTSDTDDSPLAPHIVRFEASAITINEGASATLTAEFQNGSGNISPGVGAVSSLASVTVTPATSTVYTLTVSAAGHANATATAWVTVLHLPSPASGARVLYTTDRTHSPLTASIVTRLHGIADANSTLHTTTFMKVGDSITAGGGPLAPFLGCFVGNLDGSAPANEVNVLWGNHASLRPTIEYFRAEKLSGTTTSFDRDSLAARVGEASDYPLSGSPKYLDSELAAVEGRFAVVMYGSNDIGEGGSAGYSVEAKVVPYFANMLLLTDAIMSRGVVPVLSTMPPRWDDPEYMWIVPVFTAAVRAIAQGRQVPLVDYNRVMMALGAPYGLSGDGIHPAESDYNTACHLGDDDLKYGYNLRNLITTEALARMKSIFVDGASSLDVTVPQQVGDGTASSPYIVTSLPYTDLRDTSQGKETLRSSYAGCTGAPTASGNEVTYELTLGAPTALRAFSLEAEEGNNLHLYALDDQGTCLKHATHMIAATLAAGTYRFVVDTATGSGGEYSLLVVTCDPADSRCGP